MSMQMPLARRILLGNKPIESPEIDTEKTPFDPEIAIDSIKDGEASLFDINVANDLCKDGEGIRAQAEIVKPPYPMTWMEWQGFDSAERWQEIACLVVDTSYQKNITEQLKNKLLFMFYISVDQAPRWVNTAAGYVATLTDEGQLSEVPNLIAVNGLWKESRKLDPVLEHWLYNNLCTVLVALSLINCKNVETQASGSINIKRNATEKRRGTPAKRIRYHTIILPGGGTQSDGKGGHRATALHRVRGHFKTFTAERPLLGQHVGTYWWGWQVRGNAEKGVVVSDYKLADKPNNTQKVS